jgi:hypothetical protein
VNASGLVKPDAHCVIDMDKPLMERVNSGKYTLGIENVVYESNLRLPSANDTLSNLSGRKK